MRQVTRVRVVAGTFVLGAVAVAAYHVGRAHGAGIPSPTTLVYSGSLLTFGVPDNSNHQMALALYNGSTQVCGTPVTTVGCVNGQFSLPLVPSTPSCVTAVETYANLSAQLTIDGTAMAMTALAAVPYAVEAGLASAAAAGSTLATTLTALQTQMPLSGLFSLASAATNVPVNFTGSPGSQPSYTGGVLTLPSNATGILVELWGGGGGGAGGGNGNNGGTGGTTCFSTNAAACTSPLFSASGGSGGCEPYNCLTTGGAGSGGNVNMAGASSFGITGATSANNYWPGGIGGSAPRGGGGGGGSAYFTGGTGAPFGGGGGGGGIYNTNNSYQSGAGGGGGGYSEMLIPSPTATYYFTVGGGGGAGAAGSPPGTQTVYAGGPGGPGGIVITVYN